MIAHIPTTASRTSHKLSEPTGGRESRAMSWAVRLARICLAIYLVPVLLVMFLVGGIGVAFLGVATAIAKLASAVRSALETRENGFPL